MLALFLSAPAHAQWPTDTVVTPANATELRGVLTHQVFGDCGFPTGAAMVTGTSGYYGWSYQTLSSGAKFFDTGANRLLVFHGGHSQEATNSDSGGPLIQYALSLGWDVLTVNMPSGDHSRFANDPHPLTNFMTPVALSLNYAIQNNAYQSVVMAGLSGGGWTTVLYAAMDTRITKSFPVAGSWPEYLRYASSNPNTVGDYEQQLPGITVTSYLDLYALATTDQRSQLQVFNSDDPCCFAGSAPLGYLDEIQAAASALGGEFGIQIVTSSQHTVHPSVFDEIAGSPPPPVPVTARWELDELTGATLIDANGRFNGTFFNAPSMGLPGIVSGTSISFDGLSSYATVPDHVDLRPGTKEYAIEMWAAFDNTNYGMAFGKFDDWYPYTGATVFFNMAGENPTPGRIQLRDKRMWGYWVDSTATGLNDGVPRYYIMQRRRVSVAPELWKLEIYINGVLDAETTLPAVEPLNSAGQLFLFSRPQASQYLRGTYDRTQFHVGKAFTPAEALSNYTTQLP